MRSPVDADLLDRAERLMRRLLGAEVHLGEAQLLKSWARNDVVRARVVGSTSAAPASVVIKRFKSGRERGFDDWASLAFLSRLDLQPPLAPRFLGGDASADLFVVEDLGVGDTLEDRLQGGDPRAARAALVEVARLTGRLNGGTLSRSDEYDSLRDGLLRRECATATAAADFLRTHAATVRDWLRVTGVREPPGFGDEIAAVAARVENPGPFRAFTHGDMAPSNNILAAGGTRLVDFEYGGVRHALYDGLMWNLFCPFPADLIEEADAAYRTELAVWRADARDDGIYRRERGCVAAWRTLNLLQWLPPRLLQRDRAWAPDMSARQAVLWHLQRFGALSNEGAIAEALGGLEETLRRRWPQERKAMFVWPAFRDEP